MTSSSYGRGKRRATKKKRATKTEPEKMKKKRVVAKAKAKPAKKPAKKVKKTLSRKRAKRLSGTSRPTEQKRRPTERKSGAKSRKLIVSDENKRSRAKRETKSSSAVKAKPKRATKAKKPAARPKRRVPAKRRTKPARKLRKVLTPAQKGARTRARRKAEREALARQLAKLDKDRAKLRNKSTKAKRSLRQKLNARLKEIAKRRTDRTLVIEKLPRKTPREKKKSREELFEHFRARFHELRDIALRKRQLPEVDYRERHIDSDKSTGDIRILRIEQEVNEGSIEGIMYRVRKVASTMPGNLPIWMGVCVFTGMGERLIGYGNRVLNAADLDAAQFQTQGIESTGVLSSVQGMLIGIEDLLTEYAAEEFTVVFCEHIKLMNFARYSR